MSPAQNFDYEWYDYGDGRTGLTFTPPRLQAFLDAGMHGDGHDWERLLRRLLPRVAPSALEGTDFDPESDMFVAVNRNPVALQEMAAVIETLVADEASLRVVLRGLE